MPAHLFDGLDDDGLLTQKRIRQLAEAYGVQRMLRSPKGSGLATCRCARTNGTRPRADKPGATKPWPSAPVYGLPDPAGPISRPTGRRFRGETSH